MKPKPSGIKIDDRNLGDEWMDWDGCTMAESFDTDYRVFLGLAVITTLAIILAAGLFLWLIYPRLTDAGEFLPALFSYLFLGFSAVLIIWMLLFVGAVAFQRPFTRLIIIPKLVNRLLSLVLAVGPVFGISRDRLSNSFLKVHNLFLGSGPVRTTSDNLLLLLPRCLTAENRQRLKELQENYGFKMATVGGGSAARKKIKEFRPRLIIAIACERDLLSGFLEINTHIPVIGFPNRRPEGPCKNTCVDLTQIEVTIKNCLI